MSTHPAAAPRPVVLPPLRFPAEPPRLAPQPHECKALWDRYAMPPHIREHSQLVADMACALARQAQEHGAQPQIPSLQAAALLHDLGKWHSIQHGGSHSQLGAAWVLEETRNPYLAQGVIHHVRWLWDIDADNDLHLPWFCLIYADKRVMHAQVVSTDERFQDLLLRYGRTPEAKRRIIEAHEQNLRIEAALSQRLRLDLHEHTFDSGRLVQRT